MSDNFKYFKHIENNSLSTQSVLNEFLNNILKDGVQVFELQIEIGGVMQSKITKDNPNNWSEITKDEFNNLIIKQ